MSQIGDTSTGSESTLRSIPRNPNALTQVSRDAAARSVEFFARRYLAHHFTLPPSRMHKELFKMLHGASQKRGARIAVAAPRGHAKSTIVSCAYVLWSICFGSEKYIVLLSESADQARDHLSHVKKELESNELLLRDFPEVCEPPGLRPGPERWRREEIITRNGIKASALGSQSRIRGRKNRQDRPTLIIGDDLEGNAGVESADQRLKLKEWFSQAVCQAGTATTNIVVVGTVLHYDALLTRLITPGDAPGWTGRKYQAVEEWSTHLDLWEHWESIYHGQQEHQGQTGPVAAQAYFGAHSTEMMEGTKVLWPQREPYEHLMELRARDGRVTFDREKQNEPVNPAECLFRADEIVYWDNEYANAEELVQRLGGQSMIVGACDPSLGKAGRHADDTAIVSLLVHRPSGVLYVLDADIRRLKPDGIVEAIHSYHEMRNYTVFAIEDNQFHAVLVNHVRERGRRGRQVPVQGRTHTTDKIARVQRLQPLVAAGKIRFSKRHRLLMEQLLQFPHGAHDDGPDALEMAVQESNYRPVSRIRWIEW